MKEEKFIVATEPAEGAKNFNGLHEKNTHPVTIFKKPQAAGSWNSFLYQQFMQQSTIFAFSSKAKKQVRPKPRHNYQCNLSCG